MTFCSKSYKLHSNDEKTTATNDNALHLTFNHSTVDFWRHKRMYQFIDPIIEGHPSATWLTLGDGRYGSDAFYLQEKNSDVTVSSISVETLSKAAQAGYISKYEQQNAENLSYKEDEFDFVLCKEAFHHFPRPYLALYEMLRVAKKGIVLIEPCDPYIFTTVSRHFFRKIKNSIKNIVRKPLDKNCFETVGNYKYMISERELEKAAIAAEYSSMITAYLNDHFIDGCQEQPATKQNRYFRKIYSYIQNKNVLCKLGINSYGVICSYISKETISDSLKNRFKQYQHPVTFQELPQNPFA